MQDLRSGHAATGIDVLEHLSSAQNIRAVVRHVLSNDIAMQLEGVLWLNMYLIQIGRNPLVEKLIEAGVILRFVEFLSRHSLPQLQLQAARALTNICHAATLEQIQVVVESGAVPKFVQLLSSANVDVREQAVQALGNIPNESLDYRDLILANGGFLQLMAQLNQHSRKSLIDNTIHTLSVMCWPHPAPFQQPEPFLQYHIRVSDKEVLKNACRALSYISDGRDDRIKAVIEAGIRPRLLELLLDPSPTVLIPTLRVAGNLLSPIDAPIQLVKAHAVIDEDIIPPLGQLLHHANFNVRKEAACAISSITSGVSNEQIRILVSLHCIERLCDLLVDSDERIVKACLVGLDNILNVEGTAEYLCNNLYATQIECCGGLDKIENLQSHANNDIYEKAKEILEKYWFVKWEDDRHVFRFGSKQPPGGFKFV